MTLDSTNDVTAQHFVYGVLDEFIVVLKRAEAEYLASIWRASKEASTWGEFRARLDERARSELAQRYQFFGADGEVIEDESPGDEEPFGTIQDSVVGWGDTGGWPEWPEAIMFYELPEEVRSRVGRGTTSMLSGDSYLIEPGEEADLLAAFRDLGLSISRNDRLVEEASGY